MNQSHKISNTSPHIFEFAEFSFDASDKILYKDGEIITLAPKACELLAVLIKNVGKLINRDELMNQVWANVFVEETNLTHHISALRKALGEDNGRKFIETVPRKGYRFVAEVKNAVNDKSAEITFNERTVIQLVEETSIEANGFTVDAEIIQAGKQTAPVLADKIHRSVWIAAAVVLLIGTAAFFGWRYFGAASKSAASPEISFKRLTPDADATAPSISPDGASVVFAKNEKAQQSLWRKTIATGEMTQILPAFPVSEGRILSTRIAPGGNWIYYSRSAEQLGKQNVFRVSFNGGNPQKIVSDLESDFSISPDGRQIAYTFGFRQIFVADAETGEKRVVYERYGTGQFIMSDPSSSVAWSPDGTRLAFDGSFFDGIRHIHHIAVLHLQTGAVNLLPLQKGKSIKQIEWQPDGNALLALYDNAFISSSELFRIAYPGGEINKITRGDENFKLIRLSADGETLIAEKQIGNYNIWTASTDDLINKKQITIGAAAQQGSIGSAFMPDGKIVYTSFDNGLLDLWMMDANGSGKRQLTVNAGTRHWSPKPTADGRYIVYISMRSGRCQIWRMDADGGNPMQFSIEKDSFNFSLAPDGTVYFLTFLPEEQKYQIYRVPVTGGTPEKVEFDFHCCETVPIFSPDGKWVLIYGGTTPSEPPQLLLINRATDKIVRGFPQIKNQVTWSPDSKTFFFTNDSNQQLWRQSIEGGEPSQIADFYPLRLASYDISPDGRQMVFSLGYTTNEAVMIQNFSENAK